VLATQERKKERKGRTHVSLKNKQDIRESTQEKKKEMRFSLLRRGGGEPLNCMYST
jgi:hypothetical protein